MENPHRKIRMLTEGAVCIALAEILSFLSLYKMPWGGSLDLSMLPIILYAAGYGHHSGGGRCAAENPCPEIPAGQGSGGLNHDTLKFCISPGGRLCPLGEPFFYAVLDLSPECRYNANGFGNSQRGKL